MPTGITTPSSIESRIGLLRFRDGAPDPATVRQASDQLEWGRGTEAFLRGMPVAAVEAICRGLEQARVARSRAIGLTENLLDARSLFPTPNATTVDAQTCRDPREGPMVLRLPSRLLGP